MCRMQLNKIAWDTPPIGDSEAQQQQQEQCRGAREAKTENRNWNLISKFRILRKRGKRSTENILRGVLFSNSLSLFLSLSLCLLLLLLPCLLLRSTSCIYVFEYSIKFLCPVADCRCGRCCCPCCCCNSFALFSIELKAQLQLHFHANNFKESRISSASTSPSSSLLPSLLSSSSPSSSSSSSLPARSVWAHN